MYPSMPCRFPGPHPEGSLRGLAWGGLQVHTQGEVEGSGLEGCLQAHTQVKVEGSGLGGLQAHTQRGLQAHRWGVSRPIPGGIPACTEADFPPPTQLMAIAAGGTHPTGMHSFNYCDHQRMFMCTSDNS